MILRLLQLRAEMTLHGLFDCIVNQFGLGRLLLLFLLLLLVCVLNLHFTLFALNCVCKVGIQHRKHLVFDQLIAALQRMNPRACLRITPKLVFSGHVAYIARGVDILRLLMIHLRVLYALHLRRRILVRQWNNLTGRLLMLLHILNSLLFVEVENFIDRHHLELLSGRHLAWLIKVLLVFGIKGATLRNVTRIRLIYRLNSRITRDHSAICLACFSKWIWILVVVEEERIGALLSLMVYLLQTEVSLMKWVSHLDLLSEVFLFVLPFRLAETMTRLPCNSTWREAWSAVGGGNCVFGLELLANPEQHLLPTCGATDLWLHSFAEWTFHIRIASTGRSGSYVRRSCARLIETTRCLHSFCWEILLDLYDYL